MKAWLYNKPHTAEGILVATDRYQEWLLPWWWLNYSSCNRYPVTFVDMGISPKAKAWCRERGELYELSVDDSFVATAQEVNPSLVEQWNTVFGKGLWNMRAGWFKKPFAVLKTPYQRTLWLDLDCQVCQSLSPLFEEVPDTADIALVPEYDNNQTVLLEYNLRLPDEISYNSGVLLYRHKASIIEEWSRKSVEQNAQFVGDQNVLVRLIYEKQHPIHVLPNLYNWPIRYHGENPDAVIKHWTGGNGKIEIMRQIEELKKLPFMDLSFS